MVRTSWTVEPPSGAIAPIFISRRTADDDEGYGAAAAEMEQAVGAGSGLLGMDGGIRSADGTGITICHWNDEARVAVWRKHERHTEIRQQGRSSRYRWYEVVVTRVDRSDAWNR